MENNREINLRVVELLSQFTPKTSLQWPGLRANKAGIKELIVSLQERLEKASGNKAAIQKMIIRIDLENAKPNPDLHALFTAIATIEHSIKNLEN